MFVKSNPQRCFQLQDYGCQWITYLDCDDKGSRAVLIKFLARFTLDADGGGGASGSRGASLADKGCSCGTKIRTRGVLACGKTEEGKRVRCPCARSGKLCTKKCRCRRCSNMPFGRGGKMTLSAGCRCGEDTYRRTKNLGFVACVDIKGKRQTKCPCYSVQQGCDEKCRCFNCQNSFGASNRPFIVPQPRTKRTGPRLVGCRCGEERKNVDPEFEACVDVQRKTTIKKTRCPCFRAGAACQEYCKCFNCRNSPCLSNKTEEIPIPKRGRLSLEFNLENDTEGLSVFSM